MEKNMKSTYWVSFLNDMLLSGTSDETLPHLSRRIIFSNVVYLVLPIVYLIFIFLDIEVYLQNPMNLRLDQLAVPFIAIHCAIGLYLNRTGYSYIGRLSFLLLWPALMQLVPIVTLETPSDYYLAYPLGIIFHAILIQLTISIRSEKITFILLMCGNLTLALYALDFLLFYDDESSIIETSSIAGSTYYSLVIILYWLLFNTITFYVTRVLDGTMERADKQQDLLQKNNLQLVEFNQRIEGVNKTLEKKVKSRTQLLENMNEQLSSYAYYNAHTIRGPFCRIKGILMLRELDAIEENEFEVRLNSSLDELEQAINDMQDQLNKSDNSYDRDKRDDSANQAF